jgi:hypothetical protein
MQFPLSGLSQEALTKVLALRDELAEKLDPEALWSALGLATKNDVAELTRKLNTVSKRLKDLEGGKRPASKRTEA